MKQYVHCLSGIVNRLFDERQQTGEGKAWEIRKDFCTFTILVRVNRTTNLFFN